MILIFSCTMFVHFSEIPVCCMQVSIKSQFILLNSIFVMLFFIYLNGVILKMDGVRDFNTITC